MDCPSCGASGQNGRFCMRCRTKLVDGPAAPPPVSRPRVAAAPSGPATKPKVPILVARLATTAFLTGGFCLLLAVPSFLGASMLGAALGLPLAAYCFATGVGLNGLQPWGRMLQMGLAALNLLGIPLGTALGIAELVYFNKPEVKAAFAGPDMTPADARLAAGAENLWKPLAILIGVGNLFIILAMLGTAFAVILPQFLRR
jgi:hypothetical protein